MVPPSLCDVPGQLLLIGIISVNTLWLVLLCTVIVETAMFLGIVNLSAPAAINS